jgi:hypothetical protein
MGYVAFRQLDILRIKMRPAGVISLSLALRLGLGKVVFHLIIITTTMSSIMVGLAGGALAVGSMMGVAYKVAMDSLESEAPLAAATRWLVVGPPLSVIKLSAGRPALLAVPTPAMG